MWFYCDLYALIEFLDPQNIHVDTKNTILWLILTELQANEESGGHFGSHLGYTMKLWFYYDFND